MKTMPAKPQFLRTTAVGRPARLDRAAEVLYGYVVAQEGDFKSEGRGRFDAQSLSEIAAMGNAARGGLKSRFTHPGASSDALGKHLGRAKNFTLSTTTDASGKTVRAVRADLHFNPSAHKSPDGDLSEYVMSLAESDPDAISSSLVIDPTYYVEGRRGELVELERGEEPPEGVTPLWRPRRLLASDIVDTGDAVDGLLSVGSGDLGHWDNLARAAEHGLDQLFAGQPREVVEARVKDYLERYLTRRYGEVPPPPPTPRLDALAARLARMGAKA